MVGDYIRTPSNPAQTAGSFLYDYRGLARSSVDDMKGSVFSPKYLNPAILLPDQPKGAWAWLLLAIVYGITFLIAHQSAALWGGSYYFSLFYPAAGVRFALLWHFGARLTPLLTIAELLVQTASGVIVPGSADAVDQIVSVSRAPISYGLAIALVRWIAKRGGTEIATPPMPFALATVLAPITAALASVGWAFAARPYFNSPSAEPAVTTGTVFMVGDLLGVLMLAPAVLAFINAVGRRPAFWQVSMRHAGEVVVVFGCGWALALAARQIDPGLMLTPVMLTTAWIGLRSGRVAAWIAIVFTAAVALPISQGTDSIATRLGLHMGLAAVAIAGYLAGSYAEAQRRAQSDIARRDRMLYQAERLKTLRAMSVAVIHEISQPLSTLSIESRYLARLSTDPSAEQTEIAEVAAMLEKKVGTLSEMVRRLRRFGGRAVDEPSPVAIASLLHDMSAMVRVEAVKADVRLTMADVPSALIVTGQEIELVQALVNLARNAIAAAPGGEVAISVTEMDGRVSICVGNHAARLGRDYGGMGVGVLVARAIAEAHNGSLVREDGPSGHVLYRLSLPGAERPDA